MVEVVDLNDAVEDYISKNMDVGGSSGISFMYRAKSGVWEVKNNPALTLDLCSLIWVSGRYRLEKYIANIFA